METTKKPIVIFGASVGALKVSQTLINLGVDFSFFVDNDSSKWGKDLEGKPIKSPKCLNEREYAIVIASDYQAEIEFQLKEMGILDCLVLKEQFIMQYMKDHMREFISENNTKGLEKSNHVILIDLVEGIGLGGIETWSFMLAEELKKNKNEVFIISKRTDDSPPHGLEDNVLQFDLDYRYYRESIQDLVRMIIDKLPCIILSNWQSQMLVAASIAKRYYPDQIKIVSALHNDKIAIYRRQQYFDDCTDEIMCVSKKIRRHMRDDFHIQEDKLNYLESPVDFDEDFSKSYSLNRNNPLQIGFAARIDKFQKRADLLIELIRELEKKQVNYQLNIAGKGNYFDKMLNFLEENNLQDHVKLLGLVDRPSMVDFWKKQDVFLSVSDFEGASISMLEAMSYGAVPVVTEVSGVDEFVENGKNGFASQPGDIGGISNGIIRLESDRKLLDEYGLTCRKIVKEKCNKDGYIRYVSSLCCF